MEEDHTPPTRDEIDQAQRDLGAIHAYHQRYLTRRAAAVRAGRGRATSTDTIMGDHQQALTRVIALLERMKPAEVH